MMIDPDSGAMTPVKLRCVGSLAAHIDTFAARLGGEDIRKRFTPPVSIWKNHIVISTTRSSRRKCSPCNDCSGTPPSTAGDCGFA
jgi:hypothetical protein